MAKQSKAPNNRNKKEVKARAKVAAIAATKEFLNLKSREAQKLFEVYISGTNSGKSPKIIKGDIQETLVQAFGIPLDIASSVAPEIYDRCASGTFQKTVIESEDKDAAAAPEDALAAEGAPKATTAEATMIKISLKDYQYFTEFCHSLSGFSKQCKALLLSLIVFYRYNYHPSNWVHYDRKNIFYLAGLHMKTAEQQGALTQYLHRFCGLNMRVVGSNQPIVCYDFSWMHEEPPIGENNPMITLGALTPPSLRSVIEKVEQSPDAQPPS